MRNNSLSLAQTPPTRGCVIEALESRQLCSATMTAILGHFSGGLYFSQSGQGEMIDFQIDTVQRSKLSGTFVGGDGSAGILVGSVNKRGIATFNFESTNLYSNYKGKAKASLSLDATGDTLDGDCAIRLGRQHASATFSTRRIGPDLGQKSG